MAQLYFRYGAMGCGKTMQLLQVAFNYEERGQQVCVAKSSIDTKNGSKLLTRIGPERATDFTFTREDNLFEIVAKDYFHVACVLIDEAQFLSREQADQLMQIVVELNIPVIAYGLRLNCMLTDEGFEGSTRLLQIAHHLEEIKTICDCGRKATLNCRFQGDRLISEGPAVVIDDENNPYTYRSLCPHCYIKLRSAAKQHKAKPQSNKSNKKEK